MHPLIRLICFIIFAAFVSLGQYSVIGLGFFLLLLIWVVSRQGPSHKVWLMLRRMRVFYLSILLVYLWFTPGEIMFSLFENWSPTYEGLYQAMARIFALSLLVFAVETLLRLTPRNRLLTGLYYFATPFVLLGLNRDQFIIRVMLTLDLVTSNPNLHLQTRKLSFNHYFDEITQRLADKISETAKKKHNPEPIIFNLQAPPRKLQWFWPMGVFILFWSIA